VAPSAAAPAVDESRVTWGLQAVGAHTSAFSGDGIKVAVLDTGFDLQHPDFAGRNPVTRSFVAGEQVQDGNGHGTHCIGTSCGPRVPSQLPRYGIAYEAQIHAGKVLSNRGSGTDAQILARIDWALTSGCQVISMSLGADVPFGTPFSQVFETVGQRALARGTSSSPRPATLLSATRASSSRSAIRPTVRRFSPSRQSTPPTGSRCSRARATRAAEPLTSPRPASRCTRAG
jgi:subtilisin family serine protease